MNQPKNITSPVMVLGKRTRGPEQFTPHKNQCIHQMYDESAPMHVHFPNIGRGAQFCDFEPDDFISSPDLPESKYYPDPAEEMDTHLKAAMSAHRLPVFQPVPCAETKKFSSSGVSKAALQTLSCSKSAYAGQNVESQPRIPLGELLVSNGYARSPQQPPDVRDNAQWAAPLNAPVSQFQSQRCVHHAGGQHVAARPVYTIPRSQVHQQPNRQQPVPNRMLPVHAGQAMAFSTSRAIDDRPVIHLPDLDHKDIEVGMIPHMHEGLSGHPSRYPLTPERFRFLSADWLERILDFRRAKTISTQKARYKPYKPAFWVYRPQTVLALRSRTPEMRAKIYELFHSLADTMRKNNPESPQYTAAFLKVYNQSWKLSMWEVQWYAQFEDTKRFSPNQHMAIWEAVSSKQALSTYWPIAGPTKSPKSTQTPSSTGPSHGNAGANADMPIIIGDDNELETIPVVPQIAAPVFSQVAVLQVFKRKQSPVEQTEEQRERKRLRAERIDCKEARWTALQHQIEPWWRAEFPNEPVKTLWFVKLDAWERKEAGEESRKKVYAVQKPAIDKWFDKKKDGKLQPMEWNIRLEIWEKANKQRNARRDLAKATHCSPSPAPEASPVASATNFIGPQLPTRTARMDSAGEIEYWRWQMAEKIRDAWAHPMDKTCEKPESPRDDCIEEASQRPDGTYLCAHKLPTMQRCCMQGLDRDAKKCSILKEKTLFRLKMENLIEAGRLHPAHKNWIDWYDEKISAKEGCAARRRDEVDAVLQNVQTVYNQAERTCARVARKNQAQKRAAQKADKNELGKKGCNCVGH